jgi:hypothetical protein
LNYKFCSSFWDHCCAKKFYYRRLAHIWNCCTVALRGKVPEVTKLLLPHINLKHEIEILIKRGNTELLQNLSEMNISLENSDKIMVEQVLLGQDIGELVHTFEDIDLIGQFNDYEI